MSDGGLKAPFPYMGGKRSVASVVWGALGSPRHYIEPFFGSGAVLLNRPAPSFPDAVYYETVNDADGLLANTWRAIQYAPDEVARYADWPSSEADLHARHLWLVGQREDITDRLMGDPDWFDARAAGWWLWGIALWIGGGWCSGQGPWVSEGGRMVYKPKTGVDIKRERPASGLGRGVHRQVLHPIADRGVHRKRIHLTSRNGVTSSDDIYTWMKRLSQRFRHVRVLCGDWKRAVTTASITNGYKIAPHEVAIFLDPPYEHDERHKGLYAIDHDVAVEAAGWAKANGEQYRIVYAGYVGGHVEEILSGWRQHRWKTQGGMANVGKSPTRGKDNSNRECLWFSPACGVDSKVDEIGMQQLF